jgi:hypothetical protein
MYYRECYRSILLTRKMTQTGDTGQRDLMESLVQAFGYAPRFLAACHAFLTARETYKIASTIQRYFIRWADGKCNPLDPLPPEGTICISANVESILVCISANVEPNPNIIQISILSNMNKNILLYT